jgi:HPt (histidine-containing phosphotransfer) domain-containing protein
MSARTHSSAGGNRDLPVPSFCAFPAAFLFCAVPVFTCGFKPMRNVPPPNENLADLAAVLGCENVRMLVRTFLCEFPASLDKLATGDGRQHRRIAHNLKSNARLVGARRLSDHLAALEARLDWNDRATVTSRDVAQISAEFEIVAAHLRPFVGERAK